MQTNDIKCKDNFMRFFNNRFVIWGIMSVLCFGVFLTPSAFFALINPQYSFRLDIIFLCAFIPASIAMPVMKPRFLSIAILVLFMIMEFFQFGHLFWFGTPLSVFSLALFSSEVGEVVDSAKMALPQGLYPIIVIVCAYGLFIYLLLRLDKKLPKSFIASFVMFSLLSILPYKAIFKTSNINNFMPSNDSVSIYNDLVVFSAYFCIYLPKHLDLPPAHYTQYAPYTYDFTKNHTPKNIVIVLGESANANHIALLGYERDTTPLLSTLAKEGNFITKRGISSSVLTRVSLPMFFNIAYHPKNIRHIDTQTTHLFKLAKLAGFATYYISNQTEAETRAMAGNYIDILSTKENYLLRSEKIGDMVLLDELDKHFPQINKNDKNFIVLHQRSAHSPYERGYRAYPQAQVFPITNQTNTQYKINSYDNAMIFNDFIIASIFRKFKDSSSNMNYLFFIPDHGEAMGEIGKDGNAEWGHTFLSPNVANIPIFVAQYDNAKTGKDAQFLSKINDISYPTHYELGLIIANLLGYTINNPAFQKDTFYINGNSISGENGYIEVHKNSENLTFEYKQ